MLGIRFSSDPDRIPRGSRILVRYGNARISDRIARDTDINSPESIIRMSNKHRLSDYLVNTDITVPKYFSYIGDKRIPDGITLPFLFRERLRRGGRDIIFCENKENLPRQDGFLVPYFETSREYRVHVLFGEVQKVFRKMPPLGFLPEQNALAIRSSYFGWYYSHSNLDQVLCAESLVSTCKEVAKVLGSAFCGIDIAWSRIIKKWIVWEVNSAPSLNGSTLNLYVNLIQANML